MEIPMGIVQYMYLIYTNKDVLFNVEKVGVRKNAEER